jgi:hypothetical protein
MSKDVNTMKRTSILIFVLVIVSLLGASVAAAQEPGQDGERPGRRGGRHHVIIEAVVEATGLTAEEIRETMQADDATLASIIEANGGDVDEVVAQIVATITENTDKDPAEVEENVREHLTTPPSERPQREDRPGRDAPPAVEGDDA